MRTYGWDFEGGKDTVGGFLIGLAMFFYFWGVFFLFIFGWFLSSCFRMDGGLGAFSPLRSYSLLIISCRALRGVVAFFFFDFDFLLLLFYAEMYIAFIPHPSIP